ncbi:MAG: hypothetical protein JTJ21_02615, partial [Holdemanella sp.]|nr:hypothetical protein [Holdemanella sp.]
REFIVFEFILLFIIPIITNLNSCIYRNNRFDVMIVSRIGYTNYFKQCLKQSIKDIWYYPVVINAITVLIIHFMCLPIIGKDIQYVANYFTNIGMLDLCLFTLFQIIGWSFLNYFCFLLSQLILNKYAYILSLGIYSVLSTILFSIIGSIIPFEIKWIFYILSSFTLLCPGIIGIWSIDTGIFSIIIVILCFIFYSILLFILSKFVLKDREQNG